MYIRISELSEKPMDSKEAGTDIRTMIESGMFPEGHMDEKNDILSSMTKHGSSISRKKKNMNSNLRKKAQRADSGRRAKCWRSKPCRWQGARTEPDS